MRRFVPAAATVADLVLVFSGCATAATQVTVGPGPTNYGVRPQPAPRMCHDRTDANGHVLPDPNCTPGATHPKVTEDTLDIAIYRSGYTKSIRPPKAITEAEKQASAAAYSYAGPLAPVEYDHELSGAATVDDADCSEESVGGMPLTVVSP
jgi:hypothetical protein